MAITKGLFGFDPYEVQMQQAQRLIAPIAQASNPYERIGASLGTLLGASLFDVQDPRLAKASKITAITKQVMGDTMDPTDPKIVTKLENLSKILFDEGEPDAAMFALEQARKFSPKETKANEIGKTPQGFQVYQDGDQQYYLRDGKRVPYYGTLRQETVAPTGAKQISSLQSIRGDYLKEVKPQLEAFSSLNRTKAALQQYSGIGDEVAKRQFLKAAGESGSGLSNKDVAAFANFGPLGQRVAGAINRFLEGTYTEEQRKELFSLIDALQSQIETEANQTGQQYRNFTSGVEGVTQKDIDFVVPSLSSLYKASGDKRPQTPPSQQPRELRTKTGNRAKVLPSQ